MSKRTHSAFSSSRTDWFYVLKLCKWRTWVVLICGRLIVSRPTGLWWILFNVSLPRNEDATASPCLNVATALTWRRKLLQSRHSIEFLCLVGNFRHLAVLPDLGNRVCSRIARHASLNRNRQRATLTHHEYLTTERTHKPQTLVKVCCAVLSANVTNGSIIRAFAEVKPIYVSGKKIRAEQWYFDKFRGLLASALSANRCSGRPPIGSHFCQKAAVFRVKGIYFVVRIWDKWGRSWQIVFRPPSKFFDPPLNSCRPKYPSWCK